jgi:HAD superfamily hydrolase (TIGR01459 family)
MKIISGLNSIYKQYDYFIIDLWGVLHDGHAPYKHSIDALLKLKSSGKKIMLLSNAPRRSLKAEKVLDKLGFNKEMYDNLLTSGEVTYEYVKNNNNLGKNYIYIGPKKDKDIFDGLDLNIVEKAENADFAIATGFEDFGSVFSEKQNQIDDCLNNNLLLLVANPDKKVVKQTGEVQICAGLIGDYYKQNGGEVIYFGKPYNNVYSRCLEFFKASDTSKILCVGDALHTDVAGANAIGADSLFVAGGIHNSEIFENQKINKHKLEELCIKENEIPVYTIDEFKW